MAASVLIETERQKNCVCVCVRASEAKEERQGTGVLLVLKVVNNKFLPAYKSYLEYGPVCLRSHFIPSAQLHI